MYSMCLDLLATGKTDDNHLKQHVLVHLEKSGMCLKQKKCTFMVKRVEYFDICRGIATHTREGCVTVTSVPRAHQFIMANFTFGILVTMSFSIGDGKRGDLVGIPAWDATQYLYNSLYMYYALGNGREGIALFGLPLELLLLQGGKTLFWSCMLPWEARSSWCSLSSHRRKDPGSCGKRCRHWFVSQVTVWLHSLHSCPMPVDHLLPTKHSSISVHKINVVC